jgi:hypothetical protein
LNALRPGSGRVLAALFGVRIAAGPRAASTDRVRAEPGWLGELDGYDGTDALWLASCPELGAVVRARITGLTGAEPEASCILPQRPAGRHPVRWARRGRCTRTEG